MQSTDGAVVYRRLEEVEAAAGGILGLAFLYVGNGVFHPAVRTRDLGERVAIRDPELVMYRGARVGLGNPPQYLYGFWPDAVGPAAARRWTLMHLFRLPLGWFGRGPNRLPPWFHEHPFRKARPVRADLAYQAFPRKPKWNRFDPLTPRGFAWLERHRNGNNALAMTRRDGTVVPVKPQDFGEIVALARRDGLTVWEP